MSKQDLLLLPGMLCDAESWEEQITALADFCEPRVISFGDADSIDAMADIALAGAPDRFALAGHSMGGRVAQAIYRRVPAVRSTQQAPVEHPGCTFDAISRACSGARNRACARISRRES